MTWPNNLDDMGRRVAQRRMADEPVTPKPETVKRTETAKAARADRLTAALRNNLRRRNPMERKISERPGLRDVEKDAAEAADKDQDSNG